MTLPKNDLIKGLRGELLDCDCVAWNYGECCCGAVWPESLCRKAADELERLEAMNVSLKEAIKNIVADMLK